METKLIYSKLLLIMREIGSIGKDRSNTQQGYKFRGIDDVMNELHERFATHGVLILTEIIDQRREEKPTKSGGISIYSINTYRFTFIAEDGSCVQSTQIGEGMDSGDKASNKAASVALKYALLFMFLIPTEDAKDPENDSHDLKATKPQAQPTQQAQAPAAPAKGVKLLSTDDKADPKHWETVINALKLKKKKASDWPSIKVNYLITEKDEKKLFQDMNW